MAHSLQEYCDWLDERDDLIWPKPPKIVPAKATAFLKPLSGIQGVVWNIYGTLMRITDGEFLLMHDQKMRMEIALEKTIKEFNMWNSMTRKPAAPWESMLSQLTTIIENKGMVGTTAKGEYPHVDLSDVWLTLIDRLERNEYSWDESFYGNMDELSQKVAYFYHSSLQGVEASPYALNALVYVAKLGLKQGILADAQSFSIVRMLRAFRHDGKLPILGKLVAPECMILSCHEGVRKPSPSMYESCLEGFEQFGIEPEEILYISNQLSKDLTVAKSLGMRTALFAGDKLSLRASAKVVRDKKRKPDRILTDLAQIREIL